MLPDLQWQSSDWALVCTEPVGAEREMEKRSENSRSKVRSEELHSLDCNLPRPHRVDSTFKVATRLSLQIIAPKIGYIEGEEMNSQIALC